MSGWGPPADQPAEPAKKRPFAALALTALGGVGMAVAFAIVAAFVLALLFWQLMANIVMVIFVQEMRWYGPGVYTAGGELWWYVFGIGAAGALLFVPGMVLLERAGTPLKRRGRTRPA